MLTPWLTEATTRTRLEEFSDAAGLDLVALGTEADAESIKDTSVAQPLIVAASLLALDRLIDALGAVPHWAQATAGHSVGEFAAIAASEVVAAAEAIELVATRGRAMAEAAAQRPTSMAAVIGGQAEDVKQVLTGLELVAANLNGAGQVVAAGTSEAIE